MIAHLVRIVLLGTLFSSGCFAGQILISDEIFRLEKLIHHHHHNHRSDDPQFEYLAWLKNYKNTHKEKTHISSSLFKKLQMLQKIENNQFNTPEALDLIQKIEDQVIAKKTGIFPFTLPHIEGGEMISGKYLISATQKVSLEFEQGIGSGKFKTVKHAIEYSSWKSDSVKVHRRSWVERKKGSSAPSSTLVQNRIYGSVEYEGIFLNLLRSFPPSEKKNFLKVYHILENPNWVAIERYYPYSLEEIIDHEGRGKHVPPLTDDEKLKIFSDLSKSLAYLHSRKIIHNDIKPGNILLRRKRKSGEIVAVYSDYGLATQLNDQSTVADISGAGTPSYTSPERLNVEWVGANHEECLQNAFKTDVFAQGVTALELFFGPDQIQWLFPTQSEFSNFLDGFERDAISYSSIRHLIARSLEPYVSRRITAQQFSDGIEYIIRKRKEMFNRFADLDHRGSTLSGPAVHQTLGELPGYREKHSLQVTHEISTARVGEYVIIPKPLNPSQYGVSILFKNNLGMPQEIVLDTPVRRYWVNLEIDFLKKLGTLTRAKPRDQ